MAKAIGRKHFVFTIFLPTSNAVHRSAVLWRYKLVRIKRNSASILTVRSGSEHSTIHFTSAIRTLVKGSGRLAWILNFVLLRGGEAPLSAAPPWDFGKRAGRMAVAAKRHTSTNSTGYRLHTKTFGEPHIRKERTEVLCQVSNTNYLLFNRLVPTCSNTTRLSHSPISSALKRRRHRKYRNHPCYAIWRRMVIGRHKCFE